MILSGSAVQTKGFDSWLWSTTKRLMAACRSTTPVENAALETTPGEDGEEALDGVEPAGGGEREVERPAGMSAQPFDHLGVLVGGVIVEDGVNRLASRDLALDGVEEADELLMSVALRATSGPLLRRFKFAR